MLSRHDIEKELGKGVNIYPFHPENIKENSINFTVGQNAWALGSGKIVKDKSKGFLLQKNISRNNSSTTNEIQINKGNSAVLKNNGTSYVVLLPHTTTIVETSEVIGVRNHIGGTLHSKVGIVAQGVGAIGTMLGPNFAGHLMISLHNITDDVIAIPVGDTFISIIFHRLDTPAKNLKNPNISGHVDKLSELGISIDKRTREFLTQDWKCNVDEIRKKMIKSKSYKEYKKVLAEEKRKSLVDYITWRNIFLVVASILIILALGLVANYADKKTQSNVWMERYWTVILSGIVIPIVMSFKKLFNKK